MVLIFDGECSYLAMRKHSGELAEGQHRVATEWASEIAARARKLEGNAANLPERLRSSLQQGQLALMLGAGVSISCGLPSWDSLVRKAVEEILLQNGLLIEEIDGMLKAVKFGDDLLALSQVLTTFIDESDLATAVSSLLYKTKPKRSMLLASVVNLIAASYRLSYSHGRPTVVLTFNYDTLIEDALEQQKIPVLSWDRNVPLEKLPFNSVNVIHPHGILRKESPHSSSIVFTESSYGEAYLHVQGTNPLSELLQHDFVPLFVGFSFRDSYVRKIIHQHSLQLGRPSAVSVHATEALVDSTKVPIVGLQGLGFTPNDRVGWVKAGVNPVEVRQQAVQRLPSYLARWVLFSIGVEWLEVPSHSKVPSALEQLLKK